MRTCRKPWIGATIGERIDCRADHPSDEDRSLLTNGPTRVAPLAILLAIFIGCAGCALFSGERDGSVVGFVGESDAAKDSEETEAALSSLRRMSDYLESRSALRFAAEVRYDAVQESGQRIEFGSERWLAARRPDRLRLDVARWDGATELLVYDGSRVSAASPSRMVYGSIKESGTIGEVLHRLQDDLGVPTPFADLLDPQLFAHVEEIVESGARVDTVVVDGRRCEQLAFRTADLDFQLFIDASDVPVPRRLVIDYREEPGSPQFRALLRDWEIDPELPDSIFRVVPPVGAQHLPFGELLELLFGLRVAPDDAGASAEEHNP